MFKFKWKNSEDETLYVGLGMFQRCCAQGWGGLGGACIPQSASMEIFMDGEDRRIFWSSPPVAHSKLEKAKLNGGWKMVEIYRYFPVIL